MHLIRLIYASRTAGDFHPDQVEQILSISKTNNRVHNVTGILFYNNAFFLQCLEGSRIRVNDTYRRILQDGRHSEPAIVAYEEISRRDFCNWSMGYLPPEDVSGDLVLQFSGEAEFNPFSMSGESCYQLLRALNNLAITR